MGTLAIILLLCAAGAVGLFLLGVWSTVRHTSLPTPTIEDDAYPPISLLKPIKGTEESLEQNLRSFFEQDYPAPFELVFASCEDGDPGIALARRVARDYPHVPVAFVRSDSSFGLNPKVANLKGALDAATHDLVLQSDANVRARPTYVRDIVGELVSQDASLLSSMVVGVGERTVTAAMENLQLGAMIAPGTCTALHVAGVTCVIGKSMLLRRSELEALGGLELVRDILCEDFILGETYRAAGKRLVLSSHTVENVNEELSLEAFLGRHSRWLKMRAVIHVGSFFADMFANPIFLSLMAVLASDFDRRAIAALVLATIIKVSGDAFLVRVCRGTPMPARFLVVAPFKDVLMGFVWFYSGVSRSVTWRGVKLRFGKNSQLRQDDGTLPVRVARRLFSGDDAR
ncbi:MAG: glycosyltransferase [Polyangiales bacterium]|nr:glycosyltransferase [Myxococcales bacterium]MCB9662347.1 glycosyltransferase [Sandaracinaceae bacterium]